MKPNLFWKTTQNGKDCFPFLASSRVPENGTWAVQSAALHCQKSHFMGLASFTCMSSMALCRHG